MAMQCAVCGKRPHVGNQYTHRGKAKYLGGVGTKITGCTRREFRPNLQSVRVTTTGGTNRRMKVCAQCLRSGAVTKSIEKWQVRGARPAQEPSRLCVGP